LAGSGSIAIDVQGRMAHRRALRARQTSRRSGEGAQVVEQSAASMPPPAPSSSRSRIAGRRSRPDAAIADLLEGYQAFVEHLGVFRAD